MNWLIHIHAHDNVFEVIARELFTNTPKEVSSISGNINFAVALTHDKLKELDAKATVCGHCFYPQKDV